MSVSYSLAKSLRASAKGLELANYVGDEDRSGQGVLDSM
jgi:hypothetical protein